MVFFVAFRRARNRRAEKKQAFVFPRFQIDSFGISFSFLFRNVYSCLDVASSQPISLLKKFDPPRNKVFISGKMHQADKSLRNAGYYIV